MSSREDLLTLLNIIKKDEMSEMGFGADKFYPFTMRHLLYYCNPNHAFRRYRQFKIKKKSGGYRQITAPRNRSFVILLQYVNELLKAIYSPSDYAMGFTEGRSVVTNATVHKGQNYVFNIDLKDFFPSVEQPRVWKRLQLKPFNFPTSIANVIAGLCCMRETRYDEDGQEYYAYVLPQGAPTSPIITNMICDTLDRRLAGLAKRFGLHYTRYADDITFSSMHYVYSKDGEFWKELNRIISGQGFTINPAKTRLQKRGARQEVSGVIVSDKLNVTRKYVREVRSLLYIWEKYGYLDALKTFLPKYKEEKGYVKNEIPYLVNFINGKLMYLKMVKGETDTVYIRLYGKFQALLNMDNGIEKTNTIGITYIETTSLSKFEQNNSPINIVHSESGRRYGAFYLGGVKQFASVNKRVTENDENNKEKLAISYCIDAQGKPFWQIHLVDKVTVFTPAPVNIDELNNDLDSLLNTS